MYQSTYSASTLSISFNAMRSARDTLENGPIVLSTVDAYNAVAPSALGQDKPRNYTARLVMLHPELIALSENACSVEEVRLLASQVESGHVPDQQLFKVALLLCQISGLILLMNLTSTITLAKQLDSFRSENQVRYM